MRRCNGRCGRAGFPSRYISPKNGPLPRQTRKKGPAKRDPFKCFQSEDRLLDLAFFVLDMLAHNRVVLTNGHFLGHGTRVFLGHVEVARARGRVQTDLDGRRLRHEFSPEPKRRGPFG